MQTYKHTWMESSMGKRCGKLSGIFGIPVLIIFYHFLFYGSVKGKDYINELCYGCCLKMACQQFRTDLHRS